MSPVLRAFLLFRHFLRFPTFLTGSNPQRLSANVPHLICRSPTRFCAHCQFSRAICRWLPARQTASRRPGSFLAFWPRLFSAQSRPQWTKALGKTPQDVQNVTHGFQEVANRNTHWETGGWKNAAFWKPRGGINMLPSNWHHW